jgi:zinc protease
MVFLQNSSAFAPPLRGGGERKRAGGANAAGVIPPRHCYAMPAPLQGGGKRRLRSILLFILLWAFTPIAHAYPPVEEVTTPSGITAWLMPVHDLPILNISIMFKNAGTAFDPADKQGLAQLVANMLPEGAGALDAKALATIMDRDAIHITMSPDSKYFTFHIKTLSKHRDTALALLNDMLLRPQLPEAALTRVKAQMASARKENSEEPGYIAEKRWRELAYPNHPYAQDALGSDASVASLDVGDIKRFMAERFALDSLVVSVAGDITAEELHEALEKHLSTLPKTAKPVPPLPPHPLVAKGVQHSAMQSSQSVVVFGLPGVARQDKDFYAFYLLNEMLGGSGFMAKLTEELREKNGLVYSVSSAVDADEVSPLIQGSFSTRSNQVNQAIHRLQAVLGSFAAGRLTQADLANAKVHLIGGLPIHTDTTAKLASYLRTMQIDNLGKDYLDKRQEYFNAVTLDDINRLARSLLLSENLLISIAGEASEEK